MKLFINIVFFTLVSLSCSFGQSKADSLNHLIHLTKDPDEKAKKMLELAYCYVSSNPDSALHYTNQARLLAEKTGHIQTIIRSYSITGETYQINNNQEKALNNYFKAMKLAEEHQRKETLGSIYNGIGICYFYLNNFKKSEYYIRQAAQVKLELKDYTYYSLILSNLASLQLQNQKFDEAYSILKEVEHMLIEQNQKTYLPSIYNSIGAFHQMVYPQSDSCAYYYEKSLEYALQFNNTISLITAYHNLGEYYLGKKKYHLAIDYLRKATSLVESRANDKNTVRLYNTLSAVYDSLKDYKNAYYYSKKAFKVNEDVFSVEKQKAFEELEIKYQTEKKEKEIQKQKEEVQRRKNQTNTIIFIGAITFLLIGSVVIVLFQRKRSSEKFQKEKLKLFENIVHDIKTPLTLITAPLEIIKQSASDESKEHIRLIETNSQKLVNLVNELLDASKLDKGKYQLSTLTGNIDTYIKSILERFTLELREKNMQLHFEESKVQTLFSFPSNVLEKVISNLIENAIKYCPNGTMIEVQTQLNHGEFEIWIKDNGQGIQKQEQKKVFNRFYRGKNATGTGGTGIGLSLVKELVELAKGKITLTSNQQGTQFYISLPVKEVNTQAIISEDDEKPVLLIAEDDSDIAGFSKHLLQDTFQVMTVQNGEEALQAIHELLPDLILSDVMMPQKDGLALLQEIKTGELTRHIPVVLFSAKSSLESRLKGLEYGADAYIPKPFSVEELKLTLKNIYRTVVQNREEFRKTIQSGKNFEERIQSKDPYVNKVISLVVANMENSEYSVNELANDMAVSRSQLHRKLSSLTGFSTTAFIRMIRLEKAKDMLKNREGNVTEIAYKCGFNSQSYFTKSFTEYFGKSPSSID